MIKELLALPDSCVLAIIDREGSRAWVGFSTSPVQTIARICGEIKGRATSPELVVYSTGADIETLKLHCEYYRRYWEDRGFSPLVEYGRKVIQYRTRIVPSEGQTRVDVELIGARGVEGSPVGRFKTIWEARDYMETYYGTNNPHCLPVFALNADTKALLLDRQTELLGI